MLRIALAVAIAVACIALATSCSSGKTAPRPAVKAPGASPFVEALLEYTGPPERWAGPRTVTLHLLARDQLTASVYLTPSFLPETGRVPQVTARSEIEDLARAIEAPAPAFSACLYPIRARLVRADGSIVDREGCRGNQGWPSAVSRSVSSLITAAYLSPDGTEHRLAAVPAGQVR
ncbi:MAG TPA: hypothetical protein VM598_03970 [Bdellovibrionota bacterium]|nr:hypothetical protein [Bdellovibrionota bacterium]